jgi:hypothetical protein
LFDTENKVVLPYIHGSATVTKRRIKLSSESLNVNSGATRTAPFFPTQGQDKQNDEPPICRMCMHQWRIEILGGNVNIKAGVPAQCFCGIGV